MGGKFYEELVQVIREKKSFARWKEKNIFFKSCAKFLENKFFRGLFQVKNFFFKVFSRWGRKKTLKGCAKIFLRIAPSDW
jgi:hypothetical protein